MKTIISDLTNREIVERLNRQAIYGDHHPEDDYLDRLYMADGHHYEDDYGKILKILKNEAEKRGIKSVNVMDIKVGDMFHLTYGPVMVTNVEENFIELTGCGRVYTFFKDGLHKPPYFYTTETKDRVDCNVEMSLTFDGKEEDVGKIVETIMEACKEHGIDVKTIYPSNVKVHC